MNKKEKLDALFSVMSKCSKCKELKSKTQKDLSLINIFENEEFGKNIPSLWTDWYNRVNAEIMIIGQDWGPYSDMKKLNEQYEKQKTNDRWKELIDTEKSNTKKMLTKYIIKSSQGKISSLDDIYVTNAIMCARRGNQYRGENIDLKRSTYNCEEFLKQQIEIVQPKVIVTLGYYPLKAISHIYGFEIQKTLKESIIANTFIKKRDFVIIPLYHPVAQITEEQQLEQYNKIWKYI